MKINNSAIEILNNCINKVFFLDKWRRPSKPGELINSLSSEEREALIKLTSDETKAMETPGAAYWCEEYYLQKKADKELSEEKIKFDSKIKMWMI